MYQTDLKGEGLDQENLGPCNPNLSKWIKLMTCKKIGVTCTEATFHKIFYDAQVSYQNKKWLLNARVVERIRVGMLTLTW